VEVGLWGQHLTIAVKDQGDGIDENMKQRMFDPFVTKNPEGLGLGLYIVRQLISALHGSIEVADNDGGGTAITVSLPLAELAMHQQNALTLR
jgi:signal transduction histidine kinase